MRGWETVRWVGRWSSWSIVEFSFPCYPWSGDEQQSCWEHRGVGPWPSWMPCFVGACSLFGCGWGTQIALQMPLVWWACQWSVDVCLVEGFSEVEQCLSTWRPAQTRKVCFWSLLSFLIETCRVARRWGGVGGHLCVFLKFPAWSQACCGGSYSWFCMTW